MTTLALTDVQTQVDTSIEVEPLSNVARLRPHLAANGLAATLLDAWLDGPSTDAHKRMTKVVNEFHAKKQEPSEKVTLKKD